MKPCKSLFCTLIAPLSRPPQSPYTTVKQNPLRNPGEGALTTRIGFCGIFYDKFVTESYGILSLVELFKLLYERP